MTPGKKYTLSTAMFYLYAIPTAVRKVKRHPGWGPCGPGEGPVAFFLLIVAVFAGLFISVIGLARGKRSFAGPVIIYAYL